MKVFISSLISGMEAERAAAKRAIEALRHEAVMAEDFGAQANSPQIACLTGLRKSDLVVLILGARYGDKQVSGLSATHEEYREARGRKPVLTFIQKGEVEGEQASLIDEAGSWESGLYRDPFVGYRRYPLAPSGSRRRQSQRGVPRCDRGDSRVQARRCARICGMATWPYRFNRTHYACCSGRRGKGRGGVRVAHAERTRCQPKFRHG